MRNKGKQPSWWAGSKRPAKEWKPQQKKKLYTYTITKIIGSGSLGVMYKKVVSLTSEAFQIKKVFDYKRYKNRELQILKKLNHPKVIKLRNYSYTKGDNASEIY